MPIRRQQVQQPELLREVFAKRDAVVAQLLAQLAALLVPTGVTPKRFNELARREFVRFAASLVTRRNGKTNHAKVAALTGLGRAEIRRLLSAREVTRVPEDSAAAPIQRVLVGWISNAEFQAGSAPLQLPLRGSKRSFAELTRRHGGDATYRAVLDELRRVGLVHLDRARGRVALSRPERSEWHRLVDQLAAITPTLTTTIRHAATAHRAHANVSVTRVSFYPRDEIDRLLVRKNLDPAIASLITGLKASFPRHLTRRNATSTNEVVMSILLTDGAAGITRSPRRTVSAASSKSARSASRKGSRR
jgi:hypothetical protein